MKKNLTFNTKNTQTASKVRVSDFFFFCEAVIHSVAYFISSSYHRCFDEDFDVLFDVRVCVPYWLFRSF